MGFEARRAFSVPRRAATSRTASAMARKSFFRSAPWLPATFALIRMFGLPAVTASRPVRTRSCSSPRLPKDVPEATTYRTNDRGGTRCIEWK
jgi:hypothetical protein